MNRSKARELHNKIQKYLDGFPGDEKIVLGNATIDGLIMNIKLEVTSPDADGRIVSKMETNFKKYAEIYGLQKDDLHRPMQHPSTGDVYLVCGINPKAKKYPILCKKIQTGVVYKFSETMVKHNLMSAEACGNE